MRQRLVGVAPAAAASHDRYFLDNVAGWILELDRGRGIPWEGNYSSWLDQKSKRLAVEEKQAGAYSRTLQRELEWIRMAPKARHAKGKARINAYEQLLQEGQNRTPERVEIAIPCRSVSAMWSSRRSSSARRSATSC